MFFSHLASITPKQFALTVAFGSSVFMAHYCAYVMVRQINKVAPESERLSFGWTGIFRIWTRHAAVAPESNLRTISLLFVLVAFVLFVWLVSG